MKQTMERVLELLDEAREVLIEKLSESQENNEEDRLSLSPKMQEIIGKQLADISTHQTVKCPMIQKMNDFTSPLIPHS